MTNEINDAEGPTIKYTVTEGRLRVLKVTYYRGCPIYIRQIDEDIFEYILIFDNQIYSSYIVVTHDEENVKLTERQVMEAAGLIFTAATATIDTIIQIKKDEILSNAAKQPEKKIVN